MHFVLDMHMHTMHNGRIMTSQYATRKGATSVAPAPFARSAQPNPTLSAFLRTGPAALSVPHSVATPETAVSVAAGERPPAVSPAPSPTPQNERVTLKDRVLALYREHPELTKREAARHLGAPHGSVAAYSWGLGLKWAAGRRGRPCVTAPAASEGAPARRTLRNPFALIEYDEEPRKIRRPRGELFWLRDLDGRYLDRFCTGMTRDRRTAWTGTAQQLIGCRGTFGLARELREMPVEIQRVLR